MKRLVIAGTAACLAALMAAGAAQADTQVQTRRPGFFEQLFGGSPSRAEARRGDRRPSLFGSPKDEVSSPKLTKKQRREIAESDPEGDPGLGMGNLTYVPPKLVPLSGAKLSGARPADAAAAAIYDQLGGSGASIRVLPAAREAILAQYAAQNYRPFWFENGKLTERGEAVLKLLAAADQEGLEPQSYLPSGLSSYDAALTAGDAAAEARLDIDLMGAALRYARDASGGQFDPALLSRYHDVSPPWVPASQAIKILAYSPFAADYLKRLQPTHPAYLAMKKELAELRAAEGKPALHTIADGKIVKKGETDPRIPTVRQRLDQLGYDVADAEPQDQEMLDATLSTKLRLFQKAAGIKQTGQLGPQTVAALNTDESRRSIDKLLDNMERVRWLPRQLGSRYVFVNQPAYQAQVIKNGQPEWTTRVIVGKPDTQTPVFNDEMEMVVFNPSWGVPPSIIANEYLPKLRRDPAYLDKLGFKVVTPEGKVVPSRSIRWSSYGRKVPYGIQQPPGDKNALGELKFLFPNTHNIYMHDTPFRELFEKDVRAFSHGCVRVQDPKTFAAVVLGWTPEQVAAMVKTPESETKRLKQKLPVYLTYFTAWPDETGKIDYFSDIYGRDKAMETARSATLVAQR